MIENAIGSRVKLDDLTNPNVMEFRMYISDLLEHEKVKKLAYYEQHVKTSRLDHSINVAYYSFRIAKIIGADPRQAARAGLLHDLYWYNWHTKKTPYNHAYLHPMLALKNAEKISDLSEAEKDAIVNHMWPLSKGMPKFRESYAVTIADKYAATLEVVKQRSKNCYMKFKKI